MLGIIKIGQTVFDGDLSQDQYDKYLPDWLQKLVINREIARQHLGGQYDVATANYKEQIEKFAKSQKMSHLQAMRELLKAQEEQDVDPRHLMVMAAAGLDLAEKECGMEG